VPEWSSFFDSELVCLWSREVGAALAAGDVRAWRLAGTSIALQCDDEEEAAGLLHRAAVDAGLAFARVPADEVLALAADPRAPFAEHAPALVMLDHGQWAMEAAEEPGGSRLPEASFTATLRRRLSAFDASCPVLFAVCCPKDDSLSPSLLRVGAFDRSFLIEPPDADFVGNRFLRMLGPGVAADSLSAHPAKVGMMLATEFEQHHQQQRVALQLMRLSHRHSRRVEFSDLATLALHGTQERSSKARKVTVDATRSKTAYHEAGHACIAVIASGGANVPDYASIVPAKDFEGIVLESLAYYDAQNEFTFHSLLMRTRVWLAGRAAEELFCGPLHVSSGANSDLAAATRLAFRMFAFSGFHPDMERGRSSASNLAVLDRGDVDPVQRQRVSREVRRFLSDQYEHVLQTLREHRPFVEAVAERLLWDPVIDQSEMADLARQHGLPVQVCA
jgi:cell division protease FtsH